MCGKTAILGTLALTALAAAAVAVGGASGGAADANTWAGTWRSNYGKVVLNAAGKGTFEQCDGVIDGAVVGNTLSGRWSQKVWPGCNAAEPSGSFEWKLSKSGMAWNGWWNYTKDTARRGWSGTCIAGPCLQNGAVVQVEFTVDARANDRTSSITSLGGAGVLDAKGGPLVVHPIDFEERPNAWNENVRHQDLLLKIESFRLTRGESTRLRLSVRVVGSGTKACRPGLRGTVTLVDDPRGLANGRKADTAAVSLPGCQSHAWSNAADPRMWPSSGGSPHGGQWANIRIHATSA